MSRTLHGGGAWPGQWRVPFAKGRVTIPAPEVVAAAPLLGALWSALDGQPAPCASAPEVWTSDHADDLAVAREGCADCPAQRQCLAYAVGIGASAGTWAGRDMTPRPGRRRLTADDITEMERTA